MTVTAETDTFWENAANGRLVFQCCDSCGYTRWPAAPVCPECLSSEATWREDEGKGKIWSFVIYHRAYREALKKFVPYNVAMIELESGVRLVSRIVDTAPDEIRVGDKVEVTFRPIFDDPTPVPVFRRRMTAID